MAEVDGAPGAFMEGIVPGSHGGVVLSTEHSQEGDTFSHAALTDGEQQQRLKCCRLACGGLTTKGGGRKQKGRANVRERKFGIKRREKTACVRT